MFLREYRENHVDVDVADNPADVSSPDDQTAGDPGSVQISLLRPGGERELSLLQPKHHQKGGCGTKVGDISGTV